MSPSVTRPPTTVEELIPYIEEYGFHLHYSPAQDRWMLVGVNQHVARYCRPEACYKLRIKNHREETEG